MLLCQISPTEICKGPLLQPGGMYIIFYTFCWDLGLGLLTYNRFARDLAKIAF